MLSRESEAALISVTVMNGGPAQTAQNPWARSRNPSCFRFSFFLRWHAPRISRTLLDFPFLDVRPNSRQTFQADQPSENSTSFLLLHVPRCILFLYDFPMVLFSVCVCVCSTCSLLCPGWDTYHCLFVCASFSITFFQMLHILKSSSISTLKWYTFTKRENSYKYNLKYLKFVAAFPSIGRQKSQRCSQYASAMMSNSIKTKSSGISKETTKAYLRHHERAIVSLILLRYRSHI